MYWIYFIVFMLIVFVPTYARHEWFSSFGNPQAAEMMILFFLGLIGLVFYSILDKRFLIFRDKHSDCQKQFSRVSKDLSSTYSYIGESNRKIDILRDVFSHLPDTLDIVEEEGIATYGSLMEALRVFCGGSTFILGFYNIKTQILIKEIYGGEEFHPKISLPKVFSADNGSYQEVNGYAILRAKEPVHDIACYVVTKRKKLHDEDIDMMRPLILLAAFIHAHESQYSKTHADHSY